MINQEEDEDNNNNDYDEYDGYDDYDIEEDNYQDECYEMNDDEEEMLDDDNEYLSENEILEFISNHSQSSNNNSNLTVDEIYKMEQQIPNLIKDINSSDNPDEILNASIEIRKLLQIDNSPFLSKIIHSGGLPSFIKLLSYDNYPLIQFECCWILTNLAASTSEHTKLLIDHGAIKPLVKLLNSKDESIKQQACWTLGNIACDENDENRDLILCALPNILEIIKDLNKVRLETVQTIAWTLSNLLRSNRTAPPLEYFLKSLPYLSKLLDYNDDEVLKDTCWSLVYGISQENVAVNSKIQYVIDNDPLLCSKVIKLLYHPNIDIQTPSIRFISFISCGTIDQIKHLLNTRIIFNNKNNDNNNNNYNNINIIQKSNNNNSSSSSNNQHHQHHNNMKNNIDNSKSLISSFYNLLQAPRISHMNDVIWSLSQIIIVEKDEINQLIDSGMVPMLVNLLNNGDPPIQIDIFLILSNSIVNSKLPKQLLYLISQGSLKSMLNFYEYGQISIDPSLSSEKLIRILLLCIENILNIFLFNQHHQHHQYKQPVNNNNNNGIITSTSSISSISSSSNLPSSSSSSSSSSSNIQQQPQQYQQQCIKNIKDSNGIIFLSKLQNHSNKYIKDKTTTILKRYNKFIIKK